MVVIDEDGDDPPQLPSPVSGVPLAEAEPAPAPVTYPEPLPWLWLS